MSDKIASLSKRQFPTVLDQHSRLVNLLRQDFDFHAQSDYSTIHRLHAFPAKFPPQLPRLCIQTLTMPGQIVLDPMQGSGTTLVEAQLLGRHGVGFDIDPLAVMLTRAKTCLIDPEYISSTGNLIVTEATNTVNHQRQMLYESLSTRWDKRTQQFVNYWFALDTQVELLALVMEIEKLAHADLRAFFRVLLSSIIVTKTGGVSLAFDLAHTRPHRAKVVKSKSGEVLFGHEYLNTESSRVTLLSKTLRSPLEEFRKRLYRLTDERPHAHSSQPSTVLLGDAQNLPLRNESIDLIVTSPPYVSNAIDYMRAHKFSLVWFGYPIDKLTRTRRQYIGGEATTSIQFEPLPKKASQIVARVHSQDARKGRVVHRYYSEMTRVLREMYRVLKPHTSAVVVVGNSFIRGVDTETGECLVEIGQSVGFTVPQIQTRRLDRDRRMLPLGRKLNPSSQIQQRIHQEYIIGFYKA